MCTSTLRQSLPRICGSSEAALLNSYSWDVSVRFRSERDIVTNKRLFQVERSDGVGGPVFLGGKGEPPLCVEQGQQFFKLAFVFQV